MKAISLQNPILSGFYPDPSICRVGEDYYMVCSSFEMYPGIPVFHSRDLVNWHQIGYALNMNNGFHVSANVFAGGVMAPTIRYHEGLFYIICANFGDKGNFVITTKNPAGQWSEMRWIDEINDIDASLFFDTDGKAYIVYPSTVKQGYEKNSFHGERGIFLREFDHINMKPIGEAIQIWNSALRNAASPEAPHLYHIGDYYYLLIAEGGTEHYHAVTVARNKELMSWFEGNPANPVMTHRHLGFNYPIENVGHADLLETPSGEWYAVMLASRIIEGQYKNLGRETYICPVVWEREWPVFSPKTGKIEWEYPIPKGVQLTCWSKDEEVDDFNEKELALAWNFWGTPYQNYCQIENSFLKLKCLKRSVTEPLKQIVIGSPDMSKDNNISMVLRRQTNIDFEAYCHMEFEPKENAAAGMIVMQASNHHMRLEKLQKDGQIILRVVMATTDISGPPHRPGFKSKTSEEILLEKNYACTKVVLGIHVHGQRYEFLAGSSKNNLQTLVIADGRKINPETIGGMVGTVLGMFATGNGIEHNHYASFDWFEYRKL